ncbi:PHB depolymerase family esterase [Antribacter gilvus]|uniref:PHB depolymerase family esterase n=1 Tax=Antribacter gilvus TaxID=2304675 RepID=UPI000F7A0ACA|nr:PHB depolymerase family esterase [Antribacter gilvus]
MRPIRTFVFVAAVTLALAGCSSGEPTAEPSAPSGESTGASAPSSGASDLPPVDLPPGDTTVELEHDGGPRSYTVHVPEGLTDPAPLVLVLHHLTGSSSQARASYGFDPVADDEGFVAVYPDGLGSSWNAGGCCGYAVDERADDVGFLTTVLDQVGASLDVDPGRVYVTGFSNGAMMSYRLACETDRFAALAPVAGALLVACPEPVPASVLRVHGLDDRDVPFREEEAPWREAGACADTVPVDAVPVHVTTAACDDGRVVEVVTIDGTGHWWPDADDGYDTAAEIWEFFEAHPRS